MGWSSTCSVLLWWSLESVESQCALLEKCWTFHNPYLVDGLEHEFYDFPYVGNVIIPTDELIFFRGVGIPPTRYTCYREGKKQRGPAFHPLILDFLERFGRIVCDTDKKKSRIPNCIYILYVGNMFFRVPCCSMPKGATISTGDTCQLTPHPSGSKHVHFPSFPQCFLCCLLYFADAESSTCWLSRVYSDNFSPLSTLGLGLLLRSQGYPPMTKQRQAFWNTVVCAMAGP